MEAGGLSPNQTDIVEVIQNAGRRMTGLVADLLDLALTRPGDTLPLTRGEMSYEICRLPVKRLGSRYAPSEANDPVCQFGT